MQLLILPSEALFNSISTHLDKIIVFLFKKAFTFESKCNFLHLKRVFEYLLSKFDTQVLNIIRDYGLFDSWVSFPFHRPGCIQLLFFIIHSTKAEDHNGERKEFLDYLSRIKLFDKFIQILCNNDQDDEFVEMAADLHLWLYYDFSKMNLFDLQIEHLLSLANFTVNTENDYRKRYVVSCLLKELMKNWKEGNLLSLFKIFCDSIQKEVENKIEDPIHLPGFTVKKPFTALLSNIIGNHKNVYIYHI